MRRPDAREVSKGRWRAILASLGVDSKCLTGAHGPCPICPEGGKDRFRFDDKDGRGTWICGKCGAGDGFDLLMRLRGTDFAQTAKDVLSAAGSAPVEHSAKRDWSEAERRRALRELWRASAPVESGDPVDRYLRARLIVLDETPQDLRCVPECPVSKVPGVRSLPAMLAMVRGPDGDPATLHRTYLGEGRKADIESPRRLMPGPVPKGSAIRLFAFEGGKLGIAEGIETALAAAIMFDMPVWSAINARMLAQFVPPAEVRELTIFADNDASFAGHAAAYDLAHRLRCARGDLEIDVCAPPMAGQDWADVLAARKDAA